jgi:hypothetical protein
MRGNVRRYSALASMIAADHRGDMALTGDPIPTVTPARHRPAPVGAPRDRHRWRRCHHRRAAVPARHPPADGAARPSEAVVTTCGSIGWKGRGEYGSFTYGHNRDMEGELEGDPAGGIDCGEPRLHDPTGGADPAVLAPGHAHIRAAGLAPRESRAVTSSARCRTAAPWRFGGRTWRPISEADAFHVLQLMGILYVIVQDMEAVITG